MMLLSTLAGTRKHLLLPAPGHEAPFSESEMGADDKTVSEQHSYLECWQRYAWAADLEGIVASIADLAVSL